ncbi:MAG TPA: hypothetical protein VGI92_00375 [Gemmatimonadales bacterium]
MNRIARYAPIAALLAIGACSSSSDSHAGSVQMTINGPAAPRAITFRVVGTQTAVTVPSGKPYRIFTLKGAGDTLEVMVVANQGQTITVPVVAISLPDTRTLPTLTLLQVAATDYSIPAVGSYSISILGPD